LSLLPRPELNNIAACVHGGPDFAELKSRGFSSEQVLDFSTCCNPYAPPGKVRRSLSSLKFNQYPDSTAAELCSKLSHVHDIPSENILAGNGTTELIRLIALAYFNKGEQVLIPVPSYGEYEVASRLAGAETLKFQMASPHDRDPQISALVHTLHKLRPRAIFICNPNNPTGHYLSKADIKAILSAAGNSLVVLDEAYINFVARPWSSINLIHESNLVILRSMTKDYGLTGLRLGYTMARKDIISVLRRVCPPWNVNSAAQKAGLAVLEADGFLEKSRKRINIAGEYLIRELARLGFPSAPSAANFFLVKVGDGRSFRQTLLKQGILVRDCASFGLPEYVRIAPRTLTDCRKLMRTLRRLNQSGELDEIKK
jgi:histidinol-phosphate aminotransferase